MSIVRTTRAEEEFDSLTAVIPFAVEQYIKGLWTGMPGIIEEYDAATRRAKVLPAIMGCDTDGEMIRRKPIVDVPVIAPSCGGYTISFCLMPGDAVWLAWSMRGITKFLKTYEEEPPSPLSSLLSATDAVAFPGFGPAPDVSYSPTSAESHGLDSGISLQSADGATHISITEDHIRIRTSNDNSIDIQDTGITLKGPISIEQNGVEYTFTEATLDGQTVGVFQ